MRVPVSRQRAIVRHVAQTTLSNRAIARIVGVSPNTVAEVRLKFQQAGQQWETLASLPDDAFALALGTQTPSSPSGKAIPDWSVVHKEMQQRDLTVKLLHEEYLVELESEKDKTLQYAQFTARYRKWLSSQRISMRQFHKPGEKMFVDFCGKTMPITDQKTGEVDYAQIFVAVLGASGYTFVYAVPTQRVGDWLECHVKAYEFFGGVPRQVVTDNLKSAVLKHTKTQIVLNRSYVDMAEHYGTVINPTRSRRPKDKGLAEVMVQIVQRWILAALRNGSVVRRPLTGLFTRTIKLHEVLERQKTGAGPRPRTGKLLLLRQEGMPILFRPAKSSRLPPGTCGTNFRCFMTACTRRMIP